jgi:hypothetical protein
MVQFLKNYYSRLDKWQQCAYLCYGVFFTLILFNVASYKLLLSEDPPTYWLVLIRNVVTFLIGIGGFFCFFKSIFRKIDWGLIFLTLLMMPIVGLILWFFLTPVWKNFLK